MALYVPAARRRRRLVIFTVPALVAGLLIGALVGRVTAPTVDDRITAVRDDARQISAGLRVITLHDESDAASQQAGEGGADLVLKDTRSQLGKAFDDAPWITLQQREALFKTLDGLESQADKSGASFGQGAEAFAQQIESTFGVTT
jgi:hypothetical protein